MHKVPRYGPGAAAQAAMAQHELNAHIELPPHPFVVAMHRCWQDDRSVYLLLELCACSLYDAFFAPGDEYGGGEGAWLPGTRLRSTWAAWRWRSATCIGTASSSAISSWRMCCSQPRCNAIQVSMKVRP